MRREIPGLDLVRFVAALLVAAFHLGYWLWRDGPAHRVLALEPIAATGWVGVEIFFVISGFVIAYSAAGKTPLKFILHRIRRLYPAVWICASITLLVAPATIATYLRSLVLFPRGPWVSISYWTLPIEIAFYALVTFVIVGRLRLSSLALVLGLASTLYWLAKLAGLAVPPLLESQAELSSLLQFGAFFAAGMLLSEAKHPFAFAVFIVAAVAEIWWRASLINPSAPWGAPLLFLIALALIILSVRGRRFVDPLIAWMPARTLGLASYPIYLLHAEVGASFQRLFPNSYAGFAVALAAVAALSFIVLPFESSIRRRLPS